MNTAWLGLAGALAVLYGAAGLRFWAQRQRYPQGDRPPWVTRARSLANTEVVAFAGFVTALLTAQVADAADYRLGVCALAFAATRLAYAPAYVLDLAYLRALLASVSLLLTAVLLGLAY